MEELFTAGMMSQAVLRAASTASRVHFGGWRRGEMVVTLLAAKSSGLIAVLLATALAGVGRAGSACAACLIAGTSLLGLIAGWTVINAFEFAMIRWDMVLGEWLLIATVFLAIPACLSVQPRTVFADPRDRAIGLYLAGEVVLVAIMGWMSTGAWLNYGLAAVVLASVLAGRALARALDQTHMLRQAFPFALAALVVLIGVCGSALTTTNLRSAERLQLAQIFDRVARPSTEYFFVDRPGQNRLSGRPDLVYDEWLYPVFESLHLVEPRYLWLERALTSPTVSVIVNTSASTKIDGLRTSLPRLGYVYDTHIGSFFVWKRPPLVMPERAG